MESARIGDEQVLSREDLERRSSQPFNLNHRRGRPPVAGWSQSGPETEQEKPTFLDDEKLGVEEETDAAAELRWWDHDVVSIACFLRHIRTRRWNKCSCETLFNTHFWSFGTGKPVCKCCLLWTRPSWGACFRLASMVPGILDARVPGRAGHVHLHGNRADSTVFGL